ncbi:hypothetical protein [Streptomyces griseus]
MNDTTSNHPDLIIRNGRLIDGTGSAPLPSATVHVVVDGRITWAGRG